MWRRLSSGFLHLVAWWKFNDVSEMPVAFETSVNLYVLHGATNLKTAIFILATVEDITSHQDSFRLR